MNRLGNLELYIRLYFMIAELLLTLSYLVQNMEDMLISVYRSSHSSFCLRLLIGLPHDTDVNHGFLI